MKVLILAVFACILFVPFTTVSANSSGPAFADSATPYKPLDDAKNPKDPFEAAIEPPMPQVPPQNNPQVEPQRRIIPPLPLRLDCIVGNDSRRLALLELNGTVYEMQTGESESGGLFRIEEITETSVRIFDSRVQKMRVLKLGE